MINGYLVGDRELVKRLQDLPARVMDPLAATTQRLGYELQRRVQATKLTGQVLKVRSGRLRASITQGNADSRSRLERQNLAVYAYVGTNVSYARVWELTGRPAQTILPVKGKALKFTINGQTLFRKRVNLPALPPRPFLQPALVEFRPVIIRTFELALRQASAEALKA